MECVDFDELELDDEWSPLSGYVPLLEAEHRLVATRRALDGLQDWIGSLNLGLASEVNEQLNLIRADPEAAAYETETRMYLEEQVLGLRSELPLMQYGILVVYLFSLMESCLAGCLETMGVIRKSPVPGRIKSPKIEAYLDALRRMGLAIDLDSETRDELTHWRKTRNAIVHGLERPGGVGSEFADPNPGSSGYEPLSQSGLEELMDLVEEVVAAVDYAMHRL